MLGCFSRVQLFATLWTEAHQAPLSMRFSRQRYWNGLPYPPPGDLPDPGIEPASLMSPTLALWLHHLGSPINMYSAQFSSVAQLCLTLCNPMNCSTPGLPDHHQLLEFTQTHVHWVGWCNPAISPSVIPFSSCLRSFPTSGSFRMSQFFASGGQHIGISASKSVLPMNTQDWFPLGWPVGSPWLDRLLLTK